MPSEGAEIEHHFDRHNLIECATEQKMQNGLRLHTRIKARFSCRSQWCCYGSLFLGSHRTRSADQNELNF